MSQHQVELSYGNAPLGLCLRLGPAGPLVTIACAIVTLEGRVVSTMAISPDSFEQLPFVGQTVIPGSVETAHPLRPPVCRQSAEH